MNKVFHPIGIALCKDEESADFAFIYNSLVIGINRRNLPDLNHVDLLVESADSITNGFRQVFVKAGAEYKRVMCWFHMRKCAMEKLAILGDRKLAQQVLLDKYSLQNAWSELIFTAAAQIHFLKRSKTQVLTSLLTY